VSPEWKEKVGVGTSVRFPAGTGARGNEGVAGTVRNVRGAIGYVENAYAITNKLVATQIQNKAGNFVKPDHKSFIAAASAADWSVPGFAANVIDQAGRLWHPPSSCCQPTQPTPRVAPMYAASLIGPLPMAANWRAILSISRCPNQCITRSGRLGGKASAPDLRGLRIQSLCAEMFPHPNPRG
jgi:ABC-type phosphate transport system substrate-binding protein